MKIHVPPIKSQGIKTKLVHWIKNIIPNKMEGLWIEPFMGTGVVAFNVLPKKALLCDTNPHLINFYQAIQKKEITPLIVRDFLEKEGEKLLKLGESHYYYIRERFNDNYQPLDFLFLNRAGFNGMIRFNKKEKLNVPFCRKPKRYAQAYITKITNQVDYVYKLLQTKDYQFICQDFKKTIKEGKKGDHIYCDPPYIGRYADYYNGWNDENEQQLFNHLSTSNSYFLLSTWHHNDYRENEYIKKLWFQYPLLTREHFYHLGGKENNRNKMIEALIMNYEVNFVKSNDKIQKQLLLF